MDIYKLILNLRKGKSDEKTEAINNLPRIANELGQTRTAEELFPYILETPSFSESNWIKIAEQTVEMHINEYNFKELHGILSVLFQITKLDSKQIRSAVISCLYEIAKSFTREQLNSILSQHIVAMSKNTFPTIRASSVLLFGKLLDLYDDGTVNMLFEQLKGVAGDHAPMVRQALSQISHSLVHKLTTNNQEALLNIMCSFASDRSYAVASEVPDFLVEYAKLNDISLAKDVCNSLIEYQNWRIRSSFLTRLNLIYAHSDDSDEVREYIAQGMDDNDTDVCAAAASQIGFYSTMKDADVANAKETLKTVLNDTKVEVVCAAVKSLPYFSKIGESQFVVECLTELSSNKDKDISQAALDTLRGSSIPEESTIQCLEELSKSTEWREREPIARLLKEVINTPSEEANQLMLSLLFDEACAVRSAMLDELPSLIQKLGSEWTERELLTELKLYSASSDYQNRQTSAIAIIDSKLYEFPAGKEALDQLVKDQVANVRYIIAKRLPKDSPYLDILRSDEDPDVREICE